jgi:hypothetical protein
MWFKMFNDLGSGGFASVCTVIKNPQEFRIQKSQIHDTVKNKKPIDYHFGP